MATPDKNIKQAKVLKNNLPGPLGSDSGLIYSVRYRIVSDDKNRSSHWSDVKNLTIGSIVELGTSSYSLTHSSSTHIISLVWKPDSTHSFSQYDIFTAFNIAGATATDSEFNYVGTVSSPSYSTVFSTENNITVRVQPYTSNHQIISGAVILQTPKTNL